MSLSFEKQFLEKIWFIILLTHVDSMLDSARHLVIEVVFMIVLFVARLDHLGAKRVAKTLENSSSLELSSNRY